MGAKIFVYIVTSADGLNSWVMRYNGSASCAVYGGNTWVAPNGYSSVIVSSNGFITSSVITTPMTSTKVAAWNGSYWVLGGGGGNTFATSTNNGTSVINIKCGRKKIVPIVIPPNFLYFFWTGPVFLDDD